MNFDFYLPARIVTGTGCVGTNAARLRELGKSCLLVTGRNSARACGALDDVTAALKEQGIAWLLYDQVGQNPLLTACKEAGDLARREGVDFIVGIGGGSPLDAAKAAAVYGANQLDLMDIYRLDWPNPALPLVLVGTTAGTGSEVGPVAVLTKPDGHKQSISREDLNPRLTFGDARYTASLPYAFTVSTALDALSHALEGYFATSANELSDLFATKAVSLLARQLKVLQEIGDGPQIPADTREQLYFASVLAGLTLGRCGTCYCHTLGYYLTEEHGVAHGAACAAFLEGFLRRAARLLPERAQTLFQQAGTNLEELCGLIVDLAEDLSHIRIPAETIRQLAEDGAKTKNFARTAPFGFSQAEAEAQLAALFGE